MSVFVSTLGDTYADAATSWVESQATLHAARVAAAGPQAPTATLQQLTDHLDVLFGEQNAAMVVEDLAETKFTKDMKVEQFCQDVDKLVHKAKLPAGQEYWAASLVLKNLPGPLKRALAVPPASKCAAGRAGIWASWAVLRENLVMHYNSMTAHI
jgi:hypothetical protein